MRLNSVFRDQIDCRTFSLLFYGIFALLVGLLNKLMMAKFFFDYPIVIMISQMAVILFSLEVARMCNIVKLVPYTFDRGKDMFLPSIFFALEGYFTLSALEGMNLPFYAPVQSLLPLPIMWLSAYALRQSKPSRAIGASVILVVIGSFMAVMLEFNLDGQSIVYGILGLTCHVLYLIMIEKLMSVSNSYTPLDMVYMNAFNGLVYFLIADLYYDEIRDAFMYMMTSAGILWLLTLIALVIMGFGQNVCLFMCTSLNGSLSTSIVYCFTGCVSSFAGFALSIYYFYDINPDAINVIGLLISAVGTYMYFKLKARESNFNIVGKIPMSGGGGIRM